MPHAGSGAAAHAGRGSISAARHTSHGSSSDRRQRAQRGRHAAEVQGGEAPARPRPAGSRPATSSASSAVGRADQDGAGPARVGPDRAAAGCPGGPRRSSPEHPGEQVVGPGREVIAPRTPRRPAAAAPPRCSSRARVPARRCQSAICVACARMAAIRAARCAVTSTPTVIVSSGTLGSSSGAGSRNGSPGAPAARPARRPAGRGRSPSRDPHAGPAPAASAATVISCARTWSGCP